ncbi:MAG: DNA-formamidopyrimidine glycosylase [Patescibacteria group bacterium]
MPELPEVETIMNYLAPKYVGKTVKTIEVVNPKQVLGDISKAAGQAILSFSRHGKVLILNLSNDYFLQIHLKMSGRVSHWPTIHTRAIIHFDDKDKLYFNDPRKFGWIKIDNKLHTSKGIDVLDKKFTYSIFRKIVEKSKKNIKTLLLDQTLIAGIGNIYANDALWLSKINPIRTCNSLSISESKILFDAIKKVIHDGIKHGGSSKTYVYRLPDGTKGHYQDHFLVYSLESKPCKLCGEKIKRISQNGRSTWYCPKCQI